MVLDAVRIKRRWQDDYFLRTGHLAILKGDYMEIKNVQIPFKLVPTACFLSFDGRSKLLGGNLQRAYGKGGAYGEPTIIYTVENCLYRGRTGKIPAGISG